MRTYQKWTGLCRVGKKITFKDLGNNLVLNFTVAIDRRVGKQPPDWFRVVCWGQLARSLRGIITPDAYAFIVGELRASSFKSGHSMIKVVSIEAQEVTVLSRILSDGATRRTDGEAPGEDEFTDATVSPDDYNEDPI